MSLPAAEKITGETGERFTGRSQRFRRLDRLGDRIRAPLTALGDSEQARKRQFSATGILIDLFTQFGCIALDIEQVIGDLKCESERPAVIIQGFQYWPA